MGEYDLSGVSSIEEQDKNCVHDWILYLEGHKICKKCRNIRKIKK